MKPKKRLLSLLVVSVLLVSCVIATTYALGENLQKNDTSYADFFAKEYRFEIQDTHPETADSYIFLYTQERIQMGITGFKEGYLYKTSFEKLYAPEATVMIYPEKVTAYALVKGLIYVCSENEIFSIDYNGENKQSILKTDGAVTHIKANDTLIFYVVDDVMYRYFAPTQTIDYIGEVFGIRQLTPFSNYRVHWSRPNSDWCGNIDCDGDPEYCSIGSCVGEPMFQVYIVDTRTGKQVVFNLSGQEEEELVDSLPYYSLSQDRTKALPSVGENANVTPPTRAYATINGKTIPSTYTSGSYFTTNGTACSGHNRCKTYVTTNNVAGTTPPSKYSGSQCMGFSYWAIDYIWDNPNPFPARTSSTVTFSNGDDVKAFFLTATVRRGSVLRVRNDGHSIVYIAWNIPNTTVSVWDANWGNNCNVRTNDYQFSSFASTMRDIKYYYY